MNPALKILLNQMSDAQVELTPSEHENMDSHRVYDVLLFCPHKVNCASLIWFNSMYVFTSKF